MDSGTYTDEMVHEWLQIIRDSAWVSLHYESPSVNSLSRGEISGAGYKRQAVDLSEPASRTMWSISDIRFSGLPQSKITHFGIWSAASKGVLRAYARLPQDAIILQGHGYPIPAGKIALSIA